MNERNGLYASHIFMDESLSQDPELVGWPPTMKQFDSSKFFKEDTPLQANKNQLWNLKESSNFLYGRPPVANDAAYQERRRKSIDRVNAILRLKNMLFK